MIQFMSRSDRSRRGITLVEILIAILILGVGLISLATLFPIGLSRLREARQNNRSTFLGRTAIDDIGTRGLLTLNTFVPSGYFLDPIGSNDNFPDNANPFQNGQQIRPGGNAAYNPFVYDATDVAGFTGVDVTLFDGVDLTAFNGDYFSLSQQSGPSLPVAYDPFWYAVGHQSGSLNPYDINLIKTSYRFGRGLGFVRPDPRLHADLDTNGRTTPPAHGLQRLTNFHSMGWLYNPAITVSPGPDYPFSYPLIDVDDFNTVVTPADNPIDLAREVFTSVDDLIYQTESETTSPLVPDLSAGLQSEVEFSWMLTGRLDDWNDPKQFVGDVVVFHNRPFGLVTVPAPFPVPSLGIAAGEQIARPADEVAVEAIFGYGGILTAHPDSVPAYFNTVEQAYSNTRSVLLRWPSTVEAPEIRIGRWLADVTYERYRDDSGIPTPATPLIPLDYTGRLPRQRIHWYRIVSRGDITPGIRLAGDPNNVSYRQIVVQVDRDIVDRTVVDSGGNPIFVNTALFTEWVVNVFPVVASVR